MVAISTEQRRQVTMITRPMPFQSEDYIRLYELNGRALIANEPGLGKTFETYLYAHRNPDIRPMLVVCPAHLKLHWQRQAMEHFGMKADILSSQRPAEIGLLKNRIAIINYEILQYWYNYLEALAPKLLVIDESHNIKNPATIRAKICKHLSRDTKHIICLSGTPIVKKPIEIWTTLNILDPEEFDSRHAFGVKYCDPEYIRGEWQYNGATNLDDLHKLLRSRFMIRRLKKDVLDDLPPKRRAVVPLEITNRKEYSFAVREFVGWLRRYDPDKADRAERAERLAKIGYLKRLAAKLKLPAVMEWVDEFLAERPGEKLVLFGYHRSIVQALHEKYKDISVMVIGGMSPKQKDAAVEVFQNDKKIKIFVGNINAAGTGLTLTAAATLAFVELVWTPGEHTQAEDRIHRITQDRAALIYYLIANDTIEEMLCKILQSRQEMLDRSIDGVTDTDILKIHDLLEQEILRNAA